MKSLASLLRIVTMALILAAPLAHADDDSLPAPIDGTEEEIPFDPPPQEFDDSLPGPDGDGLPEPMGNEGSSENVVNTPAGEDDIFLPTPQSAEGVNYTPISGGTPVNTSTVDDNGDWRYGWNKRPIFSLHGGMGVYNYPVTDLPENIQGPTVGASLRVYDIGQTVFLHAYASVGWAKLGGVGPFLNIKDTIIHYGPMIEVGIGRRLSLYGSLLKRSHTLSAGGDQSHQFNNPDNYAQLVNEGWKPGLGIQYDFYVIPHGSLGVRAHVEQDMSLVALTMSIEPAPKKRMSLNFKDEP